MTADTRRTSARSPVRDFFTVLHRGPASGAGPDAGPATLVLALGISDAEAAFFSTETGLDWNVIFLLLGMMIIVG
jgi:Na+/H+ antiporter NhaD/arsenite permease-like protein